MASDKDIENVTRAQEQTPADNALSGFTDKLVIRNPAQSFRSAIEENSDIPIAPTIVLYIIAAFFIVFLVWANWATLDEVARGEGRIIPSSKVKEVQGVDKGQVAEIFVREGQAVKKGDPLLSIRSTEARSNFLANQSRVFGLQAQIERLKAEVDGAQNLDFSQELVEKAPENVVEERRAFERSRDQLQSQLSIVESQVAQRRQEVSEIESQIANLKEVIALSRQEMEMIEPLVESGAAPKVELIQLERAMKEKEGELSRLRESLPRARSALDEALARREEVITTARSDAQQQLSQTLIELRSIREKLAGFQDIQDRTTLMAPVDGLVQSINENLGGVVEPGEKLVEIVPEEDSLIIEARVNPSDIAFLHPGQKAKIKITAYDFSIYGGLDGELVDISPDSITDRQGNTFYRVRLQTKEKNLEHRGERLPLMPGMVANVDILTGEKTVMAYLLKPFFKTVDKALNER